MENVIISSIFLMLLLILFWQIGEIRKHMDNTTTLLNAICEAINETSGSIEQSSQNEANTIQALKEICVALNTAFSNEQGFMNHTAAALHNIVLCMIPFVDDIRECAIEEEDYEKAQECTRIITNLKQLVNEK